MILWIDLAIVFAANVPFGYWRGNVRKFSWQWLLAIHIPVAFSLLLRLTSQLSFDPVTVVAMVLAFFGGQTSGRWLRTLLQTLLPVPLSSCLPYDLMRLLIDWA